MVAPLVIMAGVAIGTAVISAYQQWKQSEAGRNASAAESKKMEELLAKVQTPNFDPSKLTPEDYAVVRKHIPQVAQYVAEANPSLVKADSAGAVAGRDAQMNALNKLRNLSNTGTDEQSMMLQQEATNQANIANRGRQGAIQEDFARRGAGGGGLELLAQMSNAQNVNDTQASNSRAYAMEAYRTKLQALKDSASLGGTIRGEDVQLESNNNDILNSFNQRTAANRMAHNRYVADTNNDADRFNLTNEQDVINRNTSTANDFQKYNQGREDHIKQANFDNDMDKVKTYGGIANMNRADINGATKDTNSAIAGAADGVQTGIAYYGASQQRADDKAEREKDRQAYGNNPLNRKY